jgi:O-antigen ligase
VGICFLGVFYTWLTQMGDIVKLLFKVIMTLVVLYCAASITNHVLGDYGSREGMERYDRFGRLLSMVSGQESFNQVMDDVSSGRVSLFRRSLDVFAASPFFGVGDYNFERQGISGHSSALDLFALFGLFGGLPVVLLFIYCLRTAVRTGRLDVRYPWTMASCLAFLTTYSFTTPWNSIFLASAICEVLVAMPSLTVLAE